MPGAARFVEHCRDKGLRLAIATSADTIKMEANLREIGMPSSTFDGTVTGLDVEKKKPAPDIYIMAAEKIGLKPGGCLAVTTSFDRPLLSEADWICDSLEDVPEEVLNW